MMITHPLVTDLYRIVEGEAQSALPNAPVRPDRIRAPRVSLLASSRLRLTTALRWAADVLEPAPAQREHFATPECGGC